MTDYIAIAFVCAMTLVWLGFELSAQNRRRQECKQLGHYWEQAGMGDHPDAAYVCSRCFREV